MSNAGPSSVIDATVTDTVPAALEGVGWTCAAMLGSACGDVAGTGSIAASVDLAVDGVATFTLTAVVADDAEGSIVNTAAVSVPGGTSDRDPDDNTAVDSDAVTPEPPQPPVEPQPPESGSNIPRTGAESMPLLGAGLATLLVGLLFLASSRIRFRRRTI